MTREPYVSKIRTGCKAGIKKITFVQIDDEWILKF
jgi:hypothetical protein